MTALELSYYIINNQKKFSNQGLSPLKLQKLLYYIHVWGIVSHHEVLETYFEKWNFGPVNPEVYSHYKKFGNSNIIPETNTGKKLSVRSKKFVDFILSNYIKYDAVTLSAMTHRDSPWQETLHNQTISKNSIRKFYSKLNFAKNFPLGKSKPFYPIETDLHYAYVLDFPQNESQKPFYFNSYSEYLKLEKKNQKDFEAEIKNWSNS
ncbi:MAG: type II toxin-antitoxin system antitoxin SocA domain-containing protein [Bacteroidota bacterium]